MDSNRIKGAWKKSAGEVKVHTGRLFGDRRLREKGQAEQVAGTLQSAFGKVKDALRGHY